MKAAVVLFVAVVAATLPDLKFVFNNTGNDTVALVDPETPESRQVSFLPLGLTLAVMMSFIRVLIFFRVFLSCVCQ